MESLGNWVGLGISAITGIIVPFILVLIKRNAKANDDKLSIIYANQGKMLDAVGELQLKVNDTENKTFQNHSIIKEFKAEAMTKFDSIEGRMKRQGEIILANKSDIERIKTVQELCPSSPLKSGNNEKADN